MTHGVDDGNGELGSIYLVLRVLEVNIHLVHSFKDNLEGLHDVVEHDGFPVELLRFAETLGVNQLHLL